MFQNATINNRMFNTEEGARADFHAMIQELSADVINPITFSSAPIFRAPKYGLFAQIRNNKLLGTYVLYTICKADKPGRFDHNDPIYQTSSFEDICDEWIIYRDN